MSQEFTEDFLFKAHAASFENKKQILGSISAGCFFCKKVYPASDITDEDYTQDKNDETALCPHCGIDSVIGDVAGYELSMEFLEAMHELWFERTIPLEES